MTPLRSSPSLSPRSSRSYSDQFIFISESLISCQSNPLTAPLTTPKSSKFISSLPCTGGDWGLWPSVTESSGVGLAETWRQIAAVPSIFFRLVEEDPEDPEESEKVRPFIFEQRTRWTEVLQRWRIAPRHQRTVGSDSETVRTSCWFLSVAPKYWVILNLNSQTVPVLGPLDVLTDFWWLFHIKVVMSSERVAFIAHKCFYLITLAVSLVAAANIAWSWRDQCPSNPGCFV